MQIALIQCKKRARPHKETSGGSAEGRVENAEGMPYVQCAVLRYVKVMPKACRDTSVTHDVCDSLQGTA